MQRRFPGYLQRVVDHGWKIVQPDLVPAKVPERFVPRGI